MVPMKTLYSTTAAAVQLGTTRSTVAHLAETHGIGRSTRGAGRDVAWLFTPADIEAIRAKLGSHQGPAPGYTALTA